MDKLILAYSSVKSPIPSTFIDDLNLNHLKMNENYLFDENAYISYDPKYNHHMKVHCQIGNASQCRGQFQTGRKEV